MMATGDYVMFPNNKTLLDAMVTRLHQEQSAILPVAGDVGDMIDSSAILSINPAIEVQFARLLALLEMTTEERDFVRYALGNPGDKAFWLVLADWLEERGRQEEAVRARMKGM